MTGDAPRLAGTAESLRRAFDHSFTEALRIETSPFEDLLAVRAGRDLFAIRVNEIAGLFADRIITPLPGPLPELLGVAGFRGELVPIYDLLEILGHARAGTPRWLVLVAAKAMVGLAFDEFQGHIRLPRTALAPDDSAAAGVRYVRELARTAEGVRMVIHVPSVLEAIRNRARYGVG